MSWVKKIKSQTVLDMKRSRAITTITPLHQERKCVFWTNTIPQGGEQLELGSPKSIDYMKREDVFIFVVGYFGEFEVEFFLLIKGKDQVWNAYRDDCDEMFRVDNLHRLDYDLVEQISCEFRIKENKKRLGIK
jgi:hypothetical protein